MKKNHKPIKQILKAISLSAIAFLLVFTFSCKKDKDKDDPTPVTKQYVLQIQNGAQTIGMDGNLTYSAVVISTDGVATPATGVSWTTSNAEVATIASNGAITIKGQGAITITASVTYEGKNLTCSVPLGIMVPTIFAVAPSAIIYEKGGSLQLETLFIGGQGTPTYTYTSSNANIATVSSTGLVNFVAAGSCTISVTSSLQPGNAFVVPVLVIDAITIPLPVVRIDLTPDAHDMFKNDTKQFTAQAYNSSNQAVTETFTWTSLDPTIASVDANGLVKGLKVGSTYIQASAKGIIGQAEIIVNPDTVIIVEPYYISLPAGGTQQFTAKAYNARNGQLLPGITNFNWMIPTYGFPIFDIATVNSTGLVTMKPEAMPGMMSFVIATVPGNEELGGAALLMVSIMKK